VKQDLKSISVIYSEDAASKFQVEKTFVPILEANGISEKLYFTGITKSFNNQEKKNN
jgi:hypothetical protein